MREHYVDTAIVEFEVDDRVVWFDKTCGFIPFSGTITKLTPLFADIHEQMTCRIVRVRKSQLNWA